MGVDLRGVLDVCHDASSADILVIKRIPPKDTEDVVLGLDVSKYQGKISWWDIPDEYQFTFIRVSDGLKYPDATFDFNWVMSRRAAFQRGAYQFFRPGQSVEDQANLMISKVGILDQFDLPCVLDIEVTDGVAPEDIRAKALQWLKLVEKSTNKKPLVYTAANWSSRLSNALSGYDLWVANYTHQVTPTGPLVPSGWDAWKFWQYTDKGVVKGIPAKVDVNIFNGPLDEMITTYCT